MIEFFFLILGYVLTIPALIIILLIATYQESREHHTWAAFLMIVSLTIIYFIFEIKLIHALIVAAAYIPIGMIWSVFRWKIHCKRSTEKAKNDLLNRHEDVTSNRFKGNDSFISIHLKDSIDVRRNTDKLVLWVVCWPISIIERSIGDAIHAVRFMVTDWFGSVFQRISDSASTDFENTMNELNKKQRKEYQTEDDHVTEVDADDVLKNIDDIITQREHERRWVETQKQLRGNNE
jgi:hypothetical protein